MKVLLLGAKGQLGSAFAEYFERRGTPCLALDHHACDVTDGDSVVKAIDASRADVLINCTAYNLVDDAEDRREEAFAVNAVAPRMIAELCAGRKIRCVHFSTDYVFDGAKRAPYVETDIPGPLNIYGASKLAGEQHVLGASAGHLVFRVSWVLGNGRQNFLFKVRQWMGTRDRVSIAEDEVSVPTFAFRIVSVAGTALEKGLEGLWHLTNAGEASRYDLVREYVRTSGIVGKDVVPVPRAAFPAKAARPGYSVMSPQKVTRILGVTIPDWRDDMKVYVKMMQDGGAL